MITLADIDAQTEKAEAEYQRRYEEAEELLAGYKEKLIDDGALFYKNADSIDNREYGQRLLEVVLLLTKARNCEDYASVTVKANDVIYDICDQYARG